METEILILVGLLILSGFFSSTELAFVVSNKIKIELRARKNKFAEKNVHYYVENPQMFFSTILISNNIVNITFATLVTYFLSREYQLGEFSILLISSTILLIFGELLPKYFARETADTFIKISSLPLRLLTFLAYPLVFFTSRVSELISEFFSKKEANINQLFIKEDFQSLIEESFEAGVVDEQESDIVKNVIEIGEQRVYEVMTPRTEIVGIELTETVENTIQEFIKSGYSKIPVYEDSLDNIKGVVFVKDMFTNPATIKDVLRDVIFVPDTKKSLEMLNEMLDKRISSAIVVDEFGGTAGMITVEDIIEELFGEIEDEYDTEDEICRKLDDRTFIISGKVEIDHITEEYELQFEEGDFETIAGFVTSKIGRIPKSGEIIDIDSYKISILRTDKRRIELIKLVLSDS